MPMKVALHNCSFFKKKKIDILCTQCLIFDLHVEMSVTLVNV